MPWKPEFQSDPAKNLMQPFPNPNDASDKIWLQSACWLWRYSCLKVWTHRRRLDWYTISSPRAFGSGELKIWFRSTQRFLRKSGLNFCMYTTLGHGQEMTLTFNTHIASYIYSFRCLLLLTFRSLAAIVSEKSTVFTFSYNKA